MRDLKLQQAARERARKIREYAAAFRNELQLQRTEIQSTANATSEDKPNVRLFVVQLPVRKSRKEAA